LKAQIVIIGDELLVGRIQDTNTQVIAKWLGAQGFELTQVTITSDRPESLLHCLTKALEGSDLVLTTGGLGPTEDDITKQIIAKLAGTKLEKNEEAIRLAKLHYGRIDKDWNQQTNSYHLIPQGVEPILNPAGLAPGLSLAKDGKLLLSAPGVPRELKAMLEGPFIELLERHFPKRINDHQVMTIRTFGTPEEKIFFEMMPNLWQELSHEGKVSSLPQILGVDIHLSFRGSPQDQMAMTEKWQQRLKGSPLEEHIWSYEFKSIEEVVLEKAREKDLKIALAESCTGGLVANRLTNISGSSSHFKGGVVAYANEVKQGVLKVKEDSLREYGAVSEVVATEMAEGVLNVLQSDVSLSLTGIAGPGGGSEHKPVGTVCIGTASNKLAEAKTYLYRGDRAFLKRRFSEVGLHRLRKIIENS